MPEIFEFEFMRKAFIVGILIALITPCIGVSIVLRRLSMIGDSLSHTSLAGVAAGLIAGVNPIIGAMAFSILAALGMEKIRKSFPMYSELAIAIVLSAGIGLAGILSGFVPNAASFSSFLFGSIVAISDFELVLVCILSSIVLLAVIVLYRELFYINFDEEAARISGIPVRIINLVFVLLIAVTISVSSRIIGILVISSLLVIPVACAMQIAKSYKQTMVYAVIIALASTISGLFVSFYADLRPGGTIVTISVLILISILLLKGITAKFLLHKSQTL